MIVFELITEKSLDKVLDVINSNKIYNTLENGNPLRSIKEVRSDLLNPATASYLIIYKNKPIGIVDFLSNNANDNYPWIGLFMIHGDYHSMGYGKRAYVSFEKKLKQQEFTNVRIGVLQNNLKAKEFWKSLGYNFFSNSISEGKVVELYEKKLV